MFNRVLTLCILLSLHTFESQSFSCFRKISHRYQRMPSTFCARSRETSTFLYKDFRDDDDDAKVLPMNGSDLEKMKDMKERHITIPIIILDAVLPGQCVNFRSTDPKFGKMLEHVLGQSSGEIGIIGFNPHTGEPLNMGSTVSVSEDDVLSDTFNPNLVAISVQAKRRFEVQGEPEMDETKSFYLADVEIVDHKAQKISNEERIKAKKISSTIPDLVEKWTEWVIKAGKTDGLGLEKIKSTIGPLPEKICDRAIWVAALLNPLPSLGVCPDVRPAMLACKNDYQRMVLAATAMQSSIDHLSGKRNLFNNH